MTTVSDTPSALAETAPRSFGRYQYTLIALLSLNFGIVFFDRNAVSFLMPFIQPELGISHTQVGILVSALSFSWAISALVIGKLSDSLGKRKLLLVLSTIAFSLCSFLSGLASSFAFLLATRLLMGVAEGGVLPISHAMVASEVPAERRGLAQGITQNFGSNLLGSFVAPVLLVSFASYFGWREAFFLAGIPGLVCAALMWFYLDEPASLAKSQKETASVSVFSVLKDRNVQICVALSILLVSYLVVCWVFMPLYLTQAKGVSPTSMGWLMGTLGVSATLGSFIITGLSDRFGRRPLLILMPLIGVILPLGALYFTGSVWVLAIIFFFGWGFNGTLPLFMATVPSESVDPRLVATALGLSMGAGELIGGVLSPFLTGMLADQFGLQSALWLMFALALLASLCACGLRETAPSRLKTLTQTA